MATQIMPSSGLLASAAVTADRKRDQVEALHSALAHASHLLPAQGPITVFIHHNTLHAFEHLPFAEGVVQGSKLFGCEPYLSEDRYREKLASGRIRVADLVAVLSEDLGDRAEERVASLITRQQLRLAMLEHPLRVAPPAELRWFVAETDALSKIRSEVLAADRDKFVNETRHWVMRDLCGDGADGAITIKRSDRSTHELFDGLFQHFGASTIERWSDATWEGFALQSLWRVCRRGVGGAKPIRAVGSANLRHRDFLLEATGVDSDLPVNEVLIRFCSAFLDQGLSHWEMPERVRGFYQAFIQLYRQAGGPPDSWLRALGAELRRLEQTHTDPEGSILESLSLLGVPQGEWETYITQTLLALRGWAGMVWQIELRADRVAHPAPSGSLLEFLAIRLVLERLSLAHVARETLDFRRPLIELREATRAQMRRHEPANVDQRAFNVFQLAQVCGWTPAALHRLTKAEWTELVAEIEAFPDLERRRIFHAAFERRYRIQTLDAISVHAGRQPEPNRQAKFYVVCCLDEREESFRRHLEEIEPQSETFGAAGFYSTAMYYRGSADANFLPLCPIIVQPRHWVVEDVAPAHDELHGRRAKARRVLGATSHRLHVGTRTAAGGALIAAALGALSSIPLVARVMFPRLTSRLRRAVGRLVQPPPHTQLRLERNAETPSPEPGHIGFSLDEMVAIGERFLRDNGMIADYPRLVAFLGHGSNSLNNPHNSAYNCGACGGGAGGPNARALAQMMNDPRVRGQLCDRGLVITEATHFVGGWHNTANDEVQFFDLDRIPEGHRADFEHLQKVIEQTCDRNAHERCRRFQSAPLTLSFSAARRHVEGRAEDLSQTRPECGHASNAVCFVGRRERTRGLFLDRRTFLTTYDPTQDDAERTILTRILQAAIPVCAGINLEYYFSYVDPTGWGAGTKLPHNLTSLLGVMDGAASDLRPGLPWQMVEIHDPVRLLFVIETTPEAMLEIMERQPALGNVCKNGWVQLATLSPDSSKIHLLRGDRFERYTPEAVDIPRAETSSDWYRGWREHLGYAVIGPSQLAR